MTDVAGVGPTISHITLAHQSTNARLTLLDGHICL